MHARNILPVALILASVIAAAQTSPAQPQAGSQNPPDMQKNSSSLGSSAPVSPSGATTPSQDEQRQPQSVPYPMTQLEPKTKDGFTYLCGGVGEEEATQMKQAARDYDMALTFATRKGEYIASVNVDIKDAGGNVQLQTKCDGPIMLVDVPKGGTYRIRAEAAGYTLNKTARVQPRRRQQAALVLTWPQQAVEPTDMGATSSGSTGSPASDDKTQ